jgi:hypothetical protein
MINEGKYVDEDLIEWSAGFEYEFISVWWKAIGKRGIWGMSGWIRENEWEKWEPWRFEVEDKDIDSDNFVKKMAKELWFVRDYERLFPFEDEFLDRFEEQFYEGSTPVFANLFSGAMKKRQKHKEMMQRAND